jgi:hypothetical protein
MKLFSGSQQLVASLAEIQRGERKPAYQRQVVQLEGALKLFMLIDLGSLQWDHLSLTQGMLSTEEEDFLSHSPAETILSVTPPEPLSNLLINKGKQN